MTGWCTDRTVLALDGDKWKTRPNDDYERKGGNGFGINGGGCMYTLNTVDRHIVAICGGGHELD